MTTYENLQHIANDIKFIYTYVLRDIAVRMCENVENFRAIRLSFENRRKISSDG